MTDHMIVLDQPHQIAFARYAAIRSRLGLEIRTGLKFKGRALSSILSEDVAFVDYLDTWHSTKPARNKVALAEQLNMFIVATFGEQFDRPVQR